MTSSVAQQYVDTGVWGKLGLKSEVDVTLLENSGDHAILAARRCGTGDRVNEQYYRNASKFRLSGGGQERAMVLPFLMVVR